jgi:hypothetical protein
MRIGVSTSMTRRRRAAGRLLPVLAALLFAASWGNAPLFAQAVPAGGVLTSAPGGVLTLWTDPRTGQLFTRPGRGRVPMRLEIANPAAQNALEQQLDAQKAETAKLSQQLSAQQAKTATMAKQVSDITPAWQDYVGNLKNKVSIGTLVWFDYGLFTHTGWGPQYLTQMNWPGPGNNLYNSFFLNRAYINFVFNPTKDWTVRVTPNIYTMTGPTANQNFGRASAYSNSLIGNLGYRLKYAYLQWNTPFKNLGIDAIKDDMIQLGEIPQPITAWEEDLYGFRFVNLTTWNWAESSTFPGIAIQGPITFGPEHLQYIDYNIGAFNNAGFHTLEGTNTKEVQGRISIYPFGARWRFDGLGLTSYYAYGYGNNTPDLASIPAALKGPNANIQRFAEVVAYTAETWGLAFEYDWGRNAWSPGNEFSASGPAAVYGLTPNLPAPLALNYAAYANLANALMNNGRTEQQGFNFFGHYHIPNTNLTVFGWLKQWNPNTKVNVNPFDFQTVTLGVAYQWNEYLRFALDTQNTLFYHNQFNFPVSYAKTFGYSNPTGFTATSIPDAVTRDTHAIMLNAEFAF